MSSIVKDKKTMNEQQQFEYIENFCQENKIPMICVCASQDSATSISDRP